jgi:hypothetical protein
VYVFVDPFTVHDSPTTVCNAVEFHVVPPFEEPNMVKSTGA